MKKSDPGATRRAIIGVMGSATCTAQAYEQARQLGRLLAEAGYVLLCGGGTGVMEGVARGAAEAGGLTLGIMPGRNAAESPPNPYIQIPLYTGISYARNYANVLSSDVVVAVAGGLGTLSEIALGLKCGKPVVLLDSWEFAIPGFTPPPSLSRAASPREALAQVRRLLGDTA